MLFFQVIFRLEQFRRLRYVVDGTDDDAMIPYAKYLTGTSTKRSIHA